MSANAVAEVLDYKSVGNCDSYIVLKINNNFTRHCRKQKISEAELTYGSLSIDHSETMKEIGELGLDIWRRQMIEPLKVYILRLINF